MRNFFDFGFRKGVLLKAGSKIRDISLTKARPIFILLGLVGLFASWAIRGVWMNELESSERSNFILMVNLATYLEVAVIFSLVYFLRTRKFDLLLLLLAVVSVFIFSEAIVLLGRRNLTLRLLLNLFFFIVIYNVRLEKIIRWVVIGIFIVGGIVSLSVTEFRAALRTGEYVEISLLANVSKNILEKGGEFDDGI